MPVLKEQTPLIGTKRKRVISGNENLHASGRPLKGAGKLKRRRAVIDASSPNDDSEMDDDEDENDDKSLSRTSHAQLSRLKRERLVVLYGYAIPGGDPESLTKSEIVEAIIGARDSGTAPPSSPTTEGSPLSELEDELPVRPMAELRRRATHNITVVDSGKKMLNRSFSLSNVLGNGRRLPHHRGKSISSNESDVSSRPNSRPKHHSRAARSKGKQVEFSDNIFVNHIYTDEQQYESPRQPPTSPRYRKAGYDALSPRRLRSKDRSDAGRRVTPVRLAKDRVGSMAESETDDTTELEEQPCTPPPLPITPPRTRKRALKSSRSPSQIDLCSIQVQASDTPIRNRLRPRHVRISSPPSDGEGDDEGGEPSGEDGAEDSDLTEEEEDEEATLVEPKRLRNGKIVGEGDDAEADEVAEDDKEDEDADDEDEAEEEEVQDTIQVSDSDADMESASTGESEDDVNGDLDYVPPDGDVMDVDEGQEEDMDDSSFDLDQATVKSLTRLKRDELVRLCDSRALDVDGTKTQLAHALLTWRDHHSSQPSSRSSTSTVKPPSTPRGNGRITAHNRKRSGKDHKLEKPLLLRSHHEHYEQPDTPPVSGDGDVTVALEGHAGGAPAADAELELDLESLGLEDREISPDKLTKLEKIGSGGFKDVFVGKLRGRKVAIAEFRDQLTAMDIKELKLLGQFNHPNIVRFLGVSIPENTKETPVMIISELCSNGDLFDYIRQTEPPPLHKVLNIMLDIARGLEYLHLCKPSVIHRDCKSSNILITSKGVAKIADFGLAKVKQSTRSMVRSLVGTVNWQAPELWSPHPKYNHKVDVFSCACVFWEMLQWHNPQKKFPWEGMNEHAIYDIVGAKKQRPPMNGLRKLWSPAIVDLIERMWAQDHQDRPTMTEVVKELEEIRDR
ncbi:kinase-like protein [Sistotremastrum niveocremeum HHB9708]|uniref:Kinase-like protein n=1 Tax=Sistotremastrum niveocremeum HHB9708 TaxID=1314777 RepID=A0A164P4E6_9AGAM|nr:kinase-like protein [Sistotremastrum niveocremeum HHB9708]